MAKLTEAQLYQRRSNRELALQLAVNRADLSPKQIVVLAKDFLKYLEGK